MTGPVGVEADHVDRGGGDVVFELGLGQAEVAGLADPGDVGGLAHGALDTGAGGVAGLPLVGGLLGPGVTKGFVELAGTYRDLATFAAGAQLAHRAPLT